MNRTRPRALVVEDQPTLNLAMCKLLEYWGYDTMQAGLCSDAIERLAVPLDLVVLDLMLPDCDGSQVLGTIRKRQIPCTVVVSTAMPPDSHPMDNVRALSPDHLLFKPFVLDELHAIANQVAIAFRAERGL